MNIPGPYLINWYKYTIYPVRLNIFTVRDFYGNPVADPGFPRGGGANSPGGGGRGAPTYDFAKFSPKLHEIERIWTPWGRPKFYYVDPPLLNQHHLTTKTGQQLSH